MIPSLVPKEDLANAIALNSGGFNLMKIIGPALGGLMIALFGAGGNFFVQAIAYMQPPPDAAECHGTACKGHFDRGKNLSRLSKRQVGKPETLLTVLRSRSRINLQLVPIRIEKVRLRSPENALITIFDIKNFDAVLA